MRRGEGNGRRRVSLVPLRARWAVVAGRTTGPSWRARHFFVCFPFYLLFVSGFLFIFYFLYFFYYVVILFCFYYNIQSSLHVTKVFNVIKEMFMVFYKSSSSITKLFNIY